MFVEAQAALDARPEAQVDTRLARSLSKISKSTLTIATYEILSHSLT
jgi:hypothetical protein